MSFSTSTAKRCSVCGQSIVKHSCVHYGALSCSGCRSFFRRTVLKESTEVLRCRKHGQASRECIIDVETRNICAKCRYDKCIGAGMREDLVSAGEAKAAKRRKLSSSPPQGTSSEIPSESSANSEQSPSEQNVEFASNYGKSNTPIAFRDIPEHIDGFTVASSLVFGSTLGRGLVKQLLTFHQGVNLTECPCRIHGLGLNVLKWLHSQSYHSFASMIPEFAELRSDVGTHLINQSARAHFTYILARYFTSRTGWDQVNWLAGESEDISRLTESKRNDLGIFPLHSLFRHCKALAEGRQVLQACIEIESMMSQLGPKMNILDNKSRMAKYLLLYRLQSSSAKWKDITRTNKECNNDIYNKDAVRRVIGLVSSLEEPLEMILSDSEGMVITKPQLSMKTTTELDLWVERHLDDFGQGLRSASFGPVPMLNWMTMLTRRVDSAKIALSTSIGINAVQERVKRIMSSHDELSVLDISTKGMLFRCSAMKMMVTSLLSLQMYHCWIDQFNILAGDTDIRIVNKMMEQNEFKTFKRNPELFRAVSLISWLGMLGSVPPDRTKELLERQDRVAKIYTDEGTFRLMTLVLFFSPLPPTLGESSAPFSPHLLTVRNRYLRAVEQRTSVPAEEILRVVHDVEKIVDITMITFSGNGSK